MPFDKIHSYERPLEIDSKIEITFTERKTHRRIVLTQKKYIESKDEWQFNKITVPVKILEEAISNYHKTFNTSRKRITVKVIDKNEAETG